jgi:hypothetical protein
MNPADENNLQIAENSQPHLSNIHPRVGGLPNNKRMKKAGEYRFKH